MGSRTQIESALKDGRMTLEQIRKDYHRMRIKAKLPPGRALQNALQIRSSASLAVFRRFAYDHVDTNGDPLPEERRKVFESIVEIVEGVEDKMTADWSKAAERMLGFDPYRYARLMHPEIMAQASDGAMTAEVKLSLERVLVAVQLRLSEVAERMAAGAFERLDREEDEQRRKEVLRTYAVESFQAALGGDFFEV